MLDQSGNPDLLPPADDHPKRTIFSKKNRDLDSGDMNQPLKDDIRTHLLTPNNPTEPDNSKNIAGTDIDGNVESLNESTEEKIEDVSEVSKPSGLTDEDIALGMKPPLKTLLILSIGPFVSQLTQALFGLIDTMWIEKALGDKGVTENIMNIYTFKKFYIFKL